MKINSPLFKEILQLTEHLGPFHSNPQIDKAYRTLRLLGVSEENTKKMINDKVKGVER
jgi:hypothetical protein